MTCGLRVPEERPSGQWPVTTMLASLQGPPCNCLLL